MTRSLTIYQGEDQFPVNDLTDLVEWPDCEFTQRAYLGEGAQSSIRLRDEDGRTGNSVSLPAGLTPISLPGHAVVVWRESGATMARMRVSPKDYTRGEQKAGRAREAKIALDDYNVDLHNIVVHNWVRGAESDKARVQGLVAEYLSGSPRPTTNLNGSNYVSSSNSVSLPATTYSRTNVQEVLASIAAAANKQFFVTIDGELFYDGNDSTAYVSPFKISDRPEDHSATVFGPQPGGYGPASSEDGQQLLSGIWLFYGDAEYVHVSNPTVVNQHAWWEDIVYDDTVTSAVQATVVANSILSQRQFEERQYAVKIGPLTVGQAIALKPGQLIDIKWRAIPDADDAYVTRRITELKWTTPEPFSFFADMILDRPLRPRGQGQKIDTVLPKPAPSCGLFGCEEHFTRSVSNGWGPSPCAASWALEDFGQGSLSTGASVDGDEAILTQILYTPPTPDVYASPMMSLPLELPTVDESWFEVLIKWRIITLGDYSVMQLLGRATDTTTTANMEFLLLNAGVSGSFHVTAPNAATSFGALVDLTGWTWATGVDYLTRFQMGTTFSQGKVWLDGDPEPPYQVWSITGTPFTGMPEPGFRLYETGPGGSGGSSSVAIDYMKIVQHSAYCLDDGGTAPFWARADDPRLNDSFVSSTKYGSD